jgi:hypothetical protein
MSDNSDPSPIDSTNRMSGIPGVVWLALTVVIVGAAAIFGRRDKPAEISEAEAAPTRNLSGRNAGGVPGGTNATPLLMPTAQIQTPAQTSPPIVHVSTPSIPIHPGETTYNGIILPEVWPPTNAYVEGRPMVVPYLTNPPAVINVDNGRQLFVDDFLIETSSLRRVWAKLELHTNNPVMKPDQAWEQEGRGPMAMPFSDGVWWDPTNYMFKMWYLAGYNKATAMAVSSNGVDWIKPRLHGAKGSNIVQPDTRDSSTVWLDFDAKEARERFKMFRSHKIDDQWALTLHVSADGTNWSSGQRNFIGAGDRSTVFWNPFRKVWVFSLRDPDTPRKRRYWEMRDLMTDRSWQNIEEAPLWVGADGLDAVDPKLGVKPQLYNLDATPYESLMIGLFTIWKGDDGKRPKHNEVYLGYSRDGFHWTRPDREPFIRMSDDPTAWNYGNVQSVGGGFTVVGRRLNFYFCGRAGANGDGAVNGAVGLGSIRRDGFCGMVADDEGLLLTRPIKFDKLVGYVFLNMQTNAPDGEIRIEIVSERGNMLELIKNDTKEKLPLSKATCMPLAHDQTLMTVNWQGVPDISVLKGRPIRLLFHVKKATLYSFWIGPRRRGASTGYNAAGGLHFTGHTDTIGNLSYRGEDYRPAHLRPPRTNQIKSPPITISTNPAAAKQGK